MEKALEPLISVLNKISILWIPLVLISLFGAMWHNYKGKVLKESLTNVSLYTVGGFLRFALARSFELWILTLFYKLSPLQIPLSWLSFGILIVAADFAYYWLHRWDHTIPAFWIWHSVHHSSTEFDFSTALRLSWAGPFLSWPFLVPLVLVGFSPLAVITAYQIVLLFQFPLHTQKIGQLPWLDKIFNTPANHRVHHGANPKYIDKNFGGMLMIWDRIFGTYVAEGEPVRYGLIENIEGNNPIYVNFAYLIKMIKKIRSEKTLRAKLLLLWRWPQPQEQPMSAARTL